MGQKSMAISGDYAQPVQVNGFSCKNCTDVDYAKKHIDPAHPKSGPFDVNADTDPSRRTEAVVFGGALKALNEAEPSQGRPAYAPGAELGLSA
jgi:hypothetical protein